MLSNSIYISRVFSVFSVSASLLLLPDQHPCIPFKTPVVSLIIARSHPRAGTSVHGCSSGIHMQKAQNTRKAHSDMCPEIKVRLQGLRIPGDGDQRFLPIGSEPRTREQFELENRTPIIKSPPKRL